MDTTGPMSDVEFFISDVNPNDVDDGLDFIRAFVQNEKLNDYYNRAVYEAENVVPKNSEQQNQENFDPNFRYVVMTNIEKIFHMVIIFVS